MAKIIAINISHKKGEMKHPIKEGNLIEDFGLEGDAHAGKWHRQISLLGVESIEKLLKYEVDGLCVGKFAENLTTQGITLYEIPVGTKLQIGNTIHEVTQIGKKCHHNCEIRKQLGDCVMPREGIFTKVIKGGKIYENDEITIIKE